MKQLSLALVLVIAACVTAANAQTYKATYATKLYLSGGGSPITPLTIQAPTLSGAYTLTLPGDGGTSGYVLQTDGSGTLSWAAPSFSLPFSSSTSDAGALFSLTNTGTGGAGTFAINNGSNSSAALTATTDGTGPALATTGGAEINNGNLSLLNTGTAGQLRFQEPNGSGSNYTAFAAQAQAGDVTYTLPAAAPTVSGQVLSSTTGGVMSWTTAGGTVSTNATLQGDGSGGNLLRINLGNSNTWTANQTFASTFLITANARIAMTNSDNNSRDLRIQEPSGTGTQYIGIRCPSVTNNGNYVWPAVVGSVGQVMTIASGNGLDSATLSWTTVGGGTASVDSTLVGDGSGGSPLGLDLAQANVWTASITAFTGFLEVRNEPLVITNTDNSANEIRFQEASGNGSNYFAIRPDTSISTNDVWIMPSDAPTVGDVLTVAAVNTPSNRFATLEWSTPTAAPVFNYTSGVSGTYNATTTDNILGVNTAAAVTINLPAANSVSAGSVIIVKDETGSANTNNITISRSGTDTVDGGTSITINLARGRAAFYSNGTNAWFRFIN